EFRAVISALVIPPVADVGDPEICFCIDRLQSKRSQSEEWSALEYNFFDSASDGFVLIDREGAILDWNRGMEQITGFLQDEVIGEKVWHIHQRILYGSDGQDAEKPGLRKRAEEIMEHVCGGKCLSLDRKIRDAQNNAHLVNIRFFPVQWLGKTSVGVSMRDMTTAFADDTERHPGEIRYETLFNALQMAVLILEEGRVVECNQCASHLFEQPEEALMGMKMSLLFPDKQPMGFKSLEEWQRLEQLSRNERYPEFEWCFNAGENETFTALVQMHHLRIGSKSLTQVILRDMNDVLRARLERDTLTAALDQTDEIMILCDREFHVQYVNATFRKHYSECRIRGGVHLLAELPIWTSAEKMEEISDALRREEAWNGEVETCSSNGNRQIIELSIWPVFSSGQELAHYICLGRDRTREQELEQRLRQTQKMEAMGALAGGVAHDFNNILQSILGFTGLALADVEPESRADRSLNEVMKAGMRARDLVQQILTFSRQTEMERKSMRLYPLIGETVKMLRGTLPTTIEIVPDLDKQARAVLADPTQIHQVLMNLCTNAYHAMRDSGGVLTVGLKETVVDERLSLRLPELARGMPYVELWIADTGPGISAEITQRIFEPYFTTKKQGEGTGLGLSTVLGIVQSHQGAVCVDSEVDVGATFRVFFPLTDGAGSEREPGLVGYAEEPPRASGERILFVDDEPAITRLCESSLEACGYRLTVLNDPHEALELFKSSPERYDMLITDQTMPGMCGIELVRACLEIRPDLPTILCTGYSESVDEDTAFEAGVRHFVLKPFVAPEMASLIRKCLDRGDCS
ncbi:MAG: PAS domain-containing protein, partial [Candidatus Sumerlaeota bacterium]